MNIRRMKKRGSYDKDFVCRRQKPENYKKGWSRFEEHHIENCKNKGNNAKSNKIVLAGKIHFYWHQVFGYLMPNDAKLFVIFFLLGLKSKWKIREVNELEFYIKEGRLTEAKNLALYYGLERRKAAFVKNNISSFGIKTGLEKKKINDYFLWCWYELFDDMNVEEIQIFISILFGNKSKKWNIKSFRALKAAIKKGNIQDAASVAGLGINFLYYVYMENIFQVKNVKAA